MKNIITNPESIIINLDGIHYFVNNKAIEIIIDKFNKGVDITFGNYVRYDEPLKLFV